MKMKKKKTKKNMTSKKLTCSNDHRLLMVVLQATKNCDSEEHWDY